MTGASLRCCCKPLISRHRTAAQSPRLQIIGGPDGIDSDRYDVGATADCSGSAFPEQVRLMVQSMLERFPTEGAHGNAGTPAISGLVVAKGGPKLGVGGIQTPPALPQEARLSLVVLHRQYRYCASTTCPGQHG